MTEKKHFHKFHLLLHSADLIKDYLRNKLLPLGISPEQARVIKSLGYMGTVSQVTLAREFEITAASMSTMIKRLIALGFVSSEKAPLNSKKNLISLTTKGVALLEQIGQVWNEVDAFMEDKIGIDNVQELTALTRSLRDAMGARAPGEK